MIHDMNIVAEGIHTLVLWLDGGKERPPNEILLRILKIQEEAGEVAEAVINLAGQNPRKPKPSTPEGLEAIAKELSDVAVTALVALESICPNNEVAMNTFVERVEFLIDRIPK